MFVLVLKFEKYDENVETNHDKFVSGNMRHIIRYAKDKTGTLGKPRSVFKIMHKNKFRKDPLWSRCRSFIENSSKYIERSRRKS